MILQLTNAGQLNAAFQSKVIGGISYQVYPVVMLVEGVHHGLGTDPVYYPPQVIQASAPHWNNMPITINHPVDASGEHVMCNADGTIRTQWEVGMLKNVSWDGKLKGELWVNVATASNKEPALLPFIQNGGQLEVSTGFLSSDDGTPGNWNGEAYNASIQEIIPDHIALLPDSTGACSWNDGCGVRFNAKNPKVEVVFINSSDLMDQLDKIRTFVYGMDKFTPNGGLSIDNYVKAVYSDYFIYKQNTRTNSLEETKCYKQMYSMDTTGNVVLQGDPVEVVEDISYRIVTDAIKNSKEENIIMAGKAAAPAASMTCKDAVTPADKAKCMGANISALIANENTSFTDADKEWLTAMNEDQLGKLVANMEAKTVEVEKIVEKVIDNTKETPTTLVGWLETAPPEVRSVVNAGLRELDNKRDGYMKTILAAETNKFTEPQLKGMDINVLESIVSLMPVPKVNGPNYTGMAGGGIITKEEHTEEVYVPQTLSDALCKKVQ